MTRIGVVVFPGSNCDRDTLAGIELTAAAESADAARAVVERLGRELLSNPLIESFDVEPLG